MKKIILITTIISIPFFYIALHFSDWKCFSYQNKNTYNIAVIDERKIRSKCKPFIDINEFVDNYRVNKQKELKEQEVKFKKEYDEIQASLDSRSIIEIRKQKFEEKIALLHKEIEEEKEVLNEKLRKISDHTLLTLKNIIKEIAKDNSYQIVLNITDDLTYFEDSIDITDKVIKNLEEQIDIKKLLS